MSEYKMLNSWLADWLIAECSEKTAFLQQQQHRRQFIALHRLMSTKRHSAAIVFINAPRPGTAISAFCSGVQSAPCSQLSATTQRQSFISFFSDAAESSRAPPCALIFNMPVMQFGCTWCQKMCIQRISHAKVYSCHSWFVIIESRDAW